MNRQRPSALAGAAVIFMTVALAVGYAVAHDDEQDEPEAQKAGDMVQGGQMITMPGMDNLMMPRMDPALGRKLFASKGCVACHAINGVGGHDATPLDAHTMDAMMNPFEFAAKMWTMAPYMIAAQEEALGGQILFTGEELAHIIAFVHDDGEQHDFSEADIPPDIWPMMHHQHGDPGAVMEHAEELGHEHGAEDEHDDGEESHSD
ncbi:MAG: hypothetical protein IH905_15915 [Proteobacteria bacterium]|nr:hypothetical protein [Pseudomonadota bacterium]